MDCLILSHFSKIVGLWDHNLPQKAKYNEAIKQPRGPGHF